MPIPVVHDGSPRFEPAERCCFCKRPTRFWCTKKDVAVCPDCAHFRKVSEVPSKKAWCDELDKLQKEQEAAFLANQREKVELERLRKMVAEEMT